MPNLLGYLAGTNPTRGKAEGRSQKSDVKADAFGSNGKPVRQPSNSWSDAGALALLATIFTNNPPKPRQVVEDELRVLLATKLFELGQLSLGKAAELAGMSKVRFVDELGRLHIPVINLDDTEIQEELRAGRGDHHRGQ
jgi:predicted HTH domain antitoxin